MDKINVYLRQEVVDAIDADALAFGVVGRGGVPNRNGFLNLVLASHYGEFESEWQRREESVTDVLTEAGMDAAEARRVAPDVLRAALDEPDRPSGKGRTATVSFRPTSANQVLATEVLDGSGDVGASRAFGEIFHSYLARPHAERCRIAFRDTHDTLVRACRDGRQVSLATLSSPHDTHRVIPYDVCVGQGERYLYFICVECANGGQRTMSFRLDRIRGVRVCGPAPAIDDVIVGRLERMRRYGAQFAINDDEEACVLLSDKGLKTYARVYTDRPAYTRTERSNDGTRYYFDCSGYQLYLYFRRFGSCEAEVLFPDTLRRNIAKFHGEGLLKYKG